MAVVALHVAAVEELVEGGGELICVAGGVGGGACWSEAAFDVVPRVHGCLLFLSVASCLFPFLSGRVSHRARVAKAGALYPYAWVVSLFARVFLFVMVSWV